ncbi:MAG: hypothetical protein A2Y41_02545 [Spirochaetes bacterium GWB1_36_13]|nr:MAG: hypothetical protein A2Y41_02545 [Spirochaetes bacterium GWB1_36_13]
MKRIEFNNIPNVFISSGIIALKHYLEEFKDKAEIQYTFELNENQLIVESERLLELLEDVYYYMGKEIYDQSLDDGNKKYYFIKEPFQAVEFTTMQSYGLAGLITKPPHGPQPTSRKKENSLTFMDLYNNDRDFANNIASFYKEKQILLKKFKFVDNELSQDESQGKGDSKIFLNDIYTKTPSMDFNANYLIDGDNQCYFSNEQYQKLEKSTSFLPFLTGDSGIKNFNSFFSKNDKKISWKTLFLARFSPKNAFYHYGSKKETISVFFFQSTNLLELDKIYQMNLSLYKNSLELIASNYISNFKPYQFDSEKEISNDFTEKNEFLFLLIFSFYKRFLMTQQIEMEKQKPEWDPFADSEFKTVPITLSYFKSDKFGNSQNATMRPDSWEELSNFKFFIRLLFYLEKNGISFREWLFSLKIIKPSEKSSQNSYRLERQLRNLVLGKVLKLKSILGEMEDLFYRSFMYKMSGEKTGYKNFEILFQFLNLYEKIIQYGGRKDMNPDLQEKSINLGVSIGQGILRYENPDEKDFKQKQANAKSGRSYIISLKKARTLKQFLDEIIRIMTKYNISVSKEILSQIDEKNFVAVKQFSLISALNQLNSVLNYQKEEKK